MKVVLNIADKLDLKSIMTAMKNEHEGYYGKPCGQHFFDNSEDLPVNHAGYFNDNYLHVKLGEVFAFGWISSAGNYCIIDVCIGTITFSGRRHGIAEILRFFPKEVKALEVLQFESVCNDVPWYECGAISKSKSQAEVFRAQKIKRNYKGTRLYKQFQAAGIPQELWKLV